MCLRSSIRAAMPEPEVGLGDVLAFCVGEEGATDQQVGCVAAVMDGKVRTIAMQCVPARSHRSHMYEMAAQGETAVRFELAAVEWRKLDAGGAEAARERVRWMRGGRRRSCRVRVTSDEAHIKLRTQVAGVRGRKRSRVPDDDTRRAGGQLERVDGRLRQRVDAAPAEGRYVLHPCSSTHEAFVCCDLRI